MAIKLSPGVFKLSSGQILTNVHSEDKCKGEFCTIHNPSDHCMKHWPQSLNEDTRMMERLCMHMIGHPDPDEIQKASHGCDGCCMNKV